MKYIKTYETKSEFEKGEYVKLKDMSFFDADTYEYVHIPDEGKIIKIEGSILVLLMRNGQIMEYTIYNVLRKMTIDEIEIFELDLSRNKYNM